MNALFDFFFTNGRFRLRAYATSAGIAFAYALINLWALGRKEEVVVPEMIGVLLLSVSSFVLWHVYKGEVASDATLPKFRLSFALAGVISLFLVISLRWINIASMQAYVADAALNHFSVKFDSVQAATLSADQVQASVQRIQSIVTTSERNGVPVNPNTVQKTGVALSNYLKKEKIPPQVKQAGYSTVLDLQSFGYTREAQSGVIATSPISSVARQISGVGYVTSSFLAFDQHDIFIKGDHSLLVLGDSIEISKVTVVFKGVDFEVRGAYPPLILGPGGTLAVIDSIFQGGQQPLDNISWIDVQFRDMQPQYHRGAIRLRNISFTGFNRDRLFLDLPPDLAQLILESGGKPINYVFEPEK
jgi:ABC-type multidrug transport system fused ATPase/permease subunit